MKTADLAAFTTRLEASVSAFAATEGHAFATNLGALTAGLSLPPLDIATRQALDTICRRVLRTYGFTPSLRCLGDDLSHSLVRGARLYPTTELVIIG